MRVYQHDLEVSGVDWCPISDKIITCSHDRNAFVWTKKTVRGEYFDWFLAYIAHLLTPLPRQKSTNRLANGYKVLWFCASPARLLLRNGALKVRCQWQRAHSRRIFTSINRVSHVTKLFLCAVYTGNKFAVTSGAKRVPICRYSRRNVFCGRTFRFVQTDFFPLHRFEKTDDWWIPEMISKHKSSVVAVDWHPNNTVIATGSTDFRCRVISAYLARVDGEDSDHAPFEDGDFGTVCTSSTRTTP